MGAGGYGDLYMQMSQALAGMSASRPPIAPMVMPSAPEPVLTTSRGIRPLPAGITTAQEADRFTRTVLAGGGGERVPLLDEGDEQTADKASIGKLGK